MPMKITLDPGQFGWDFIVRAENGHTTLIQTDWDYIGVAVTFGWRGTIDYGNERAAITEAFEFLTANLGVSVEDPGYFS